MIQFPVNEIASRWTLYDLEGGAALRVGMSWPSLDFDQPPGQRGVQIEGMEPHLQMLEEVEGEKPDHDPRTQMLVEHREPDLENMRIDISWDVVPRPDEEVIQAAMQMEAQQNAGLPAPPEISMVLGFLIKDLDLESTPAEWRQLFADYQEGYQAMIHNRKRLGEIIKEVNEGIVPDLDAGWYTDE